MDSNIWYILRNFRQFCISVQIIFNTILLNNLIDILLYIFVSFCDCVYIACILRPLNSISLVFNLMNLKYSYRQHYCVEYFVTFFIKFILKKITTLILSPSYSSLINRYKTSKCSYYFFILFYFNWKLTKGGEEITKNSLNF